MTQYLGCCLCGAVKFKVSGPLGDLHACHCSQCRRQSGHYIVATNAKRSDFVLTEERGLKWYRSSELARRGFCAECGSFLFWDDDGAEISINAGSLDQPTGLKLTSHIFADEKADYYDIADELPKFAGYDGPLPSD
ncbi:MAG: GFA family protein [Alphaproteobacteria bacterium]|nr:GFA family protein [Alphaproteobacteria bacterium]